MQSTKKNGAVIAKEARKEATAREIARENLKLKNEIPKTNTREKKKATTHKMKYKNGNVEEEGDASGASHVSHIRKTILPR